MRAEEGSEEKMKEKRTFCNHTMRQKNQRFTVRLKEHGALRYRKDKGALQNCTSNFSLGSGSVIEIQR